jgi:hypothetical protein
MRIKKIETARKEDANMTNARNRTPKFLLILPAMIGLLLATPASATELTFEANGVTSGDPMPQNYGDNVSATTDGNGHSYLEGNGFTPNVELSYSASSGGQIQYDSGDVAKLDDPAGSGTFWFTFTPDPGYGVRINSFTLSSSAMSPYATWMVYTNSVSTGTGGALAFAASADFDAVMDYYYFGTVVLEINNLTFSPETLALDNLNFDQDGEPVQEEPPRGTMTIFR